MANGYAKCIFMERYFGQIPYGYKVYMWKYNPETGKINIHSEKNEILFSVPCATEEVKDKANSKYMKLIIGAWLNNSDNT